MLWIGNIPLAGAVVIEGEDYFLVGPNVMAMGHYWHDVGYPVPKEYAPREQPPPYNITSADMRRKCLVAHIPAEDLLQPAHSSQRRIRRL